MGETPVSSEYPGSELSLVHSTLRTERSEDVAEFLKTRLLMRPRPRLTFAALGYAEMFFMTIFSSPEPGEDLTVCSLFWAQNTAVMECIRKFIEGGQPY